MSITAKPSTVTHRYTVIVTYDTDSDTYIADVPTLGLGTYSFSPDHAFEMAEEAISLWVETALEDGVEVPTQDYLVEVRQIAI